jgi:hypothetical protein
VVASFDYKKIIEDIGNKPDLVGIVKRILDGEIREYNKTLEIDNMLLVLHSKLFNDAFKIRSEHLQATVKERHTDVVFITGGAGFGKTTLAKRMAHDKGLDYFISSGSNDILDGYGQQPCLIVDDIRPSVLGLIDLLKLLDPHVASSVKSRYKNKYLNAQLVILTTVLDIDTFYKNVFTEESEPINQLKRRCKTYIEVGKQEILISYWDSKVMRYTDSVKYKNDLLDKYIPDKTLASEDVETHVSTMIPFLEKIEDEDDGFKAPTPDEQEEIPFYQQQRLPVSDR